MFPLMYPSASTSDAHWGRHRETGDSFNFLIKNKIKQPGIIYADRGIIYFLGLNVKPHQIRPVP